ncbi:MAG: diguanylate cyclase [Rhodoferax sp.]|nr:diguanylate cyclase [Rhodoferax sp.]
MLAQRPKILVIDDAVSNQQLFARMFGSEFTVELASSGMEGLALALAAPPDLILLDVMMPDVDGFETCRRLKAMPQLQPIPLMFVTGNSDPAHETQGFSLGAVDYIQKPFRVSVTLQRIRNLLDRETLRKELVIERNRLDALVNAIPDLLFEVDRQGSHLGIWTRQHALLVAEREHLMGRTVTEMMPPAAASVCMAAIAEADQTETSYGKRMQLDFDGINRWFELSIAKQKTIGQHAPTFVMVSRDITDRVEAEERIQYHALHDPLTSLPNRALLFELIKKALLITRREQGLLCVIFLDLDTFKPVNDTYGHAVGDLLLKEVAHRLQSAIRDSDTVARLGGDEFVILLPKIRAVEDAMFVAQKVGAALRAPYFIDGHQLQISASCGLSHFPKHGDDMDSLLTHADQAMYAAKAQGRDTVVMYQKKV